MHPPCRTPHYTLITLPSAAGVMLATAIAYQCRPTRATIERPHSIHADRQPQKHDPTYQYQQNAGEGIHVKPCTDSQGRSLGRF